MISVHTCSDQLLFTFMVTSRILLMINIIIAVINHKGHKVAKKMTRFPTHFNPSFNAVSSLRA
jgi:hypothetical protein